ncbi:hypothetical protein M427DRAFT_137078 [Gonapodya prolifera JEL478]|uniref:TECPR1-like DysF domain-containing protein n=1 Tax=Gonapodya prolifera (strain JEL478) TaxID=1344416 RepID=A0A139A7T9_GONPJ|nr:hypothetical protein M427DRAFT_137078 [Gonapodya prolifera JEL478]|eukprot:KXS12759.1 hypothetical protein M427DRAFT_137078 [Gonapodya prolifera JEL478]
MEKNLRFLQTVMTSHILLDNLARSLLKFLDWSRPDVTRRVLQGTVLCLVATLVGVYAVPGWVVRGVIALAIILAFTLTHPSGSLLLSRFLSLALHVRTRARNGVRSLVRRGSWAGSDGVRGEGQGQEQGQGKEANGEVGGNGNGRAERERRERVCIVENERWWPALGWLPTSPLNPFDPPAWSDPTFTLARAPKALHTAPEGGRWADAGWRVARGLDGQTRVRSACAGEVEAKERKETGEDDAYWTAADALGWVYCDRDWNRVDKEVGWWDRVTRRRGWVREVVWA